MRQNPIIDHEHREIFDPPTWRVILAHVLVVAVPFALGFLAGRW